MSTAATPTSPKKNQITPNRATVLDGPHDGIPHEK
jgi:hypothetical protein